MPPSRFPTPLPHEPWWNVFLPAMAGERAVVNQAIDQLLAADPDGDTLAICSRALFVTGEEFRAERLAIRAFHAGGHEGQRLALVHRVDGRDRAPAIAAHTPGPGRRAEVWCDLAGRCLLEGDTPSASAAIDAAARALPEHLETRRWERFLQEGGQPHLRIQQATRRVSPPEAAVMRDAVALLAHRRNGFVSVARWQRRHAAEGLHAPRGSALYRLVEAGVGRPLLFTERELTELPAGDPAADLEVRVAELRSLAAEGRPTRDPVRAVLAEVRRFSPKVQAAGVRICAELAARDPLLVPEVLDAVERLMPHDPEAWMGWVARLGYLVRPERSVRYARTLLTDPGTRPDAFLLAHEALCRCGRPEEARDLAERAVALPALRSAATAALLGA